MKPSCDLCLAILLCLIMGCHSPVVPAALQPEDTQGVVDSAEQDVSQQDDVDDTVAQKPVEASPWGDERVHPISPPEAPMERDGNVLRYTLRAGLKSHETPWGVVQGYAYNEVTPGPTLRGTVGDRLEITLINELLTPTTIHWHGAPNVPWEMDGAVWKMDPVLPGGTFTYAFDLTRAGTFWYHPHFDTDSQVDLGLFGALVVEEKESAYDHEAILIFDSFEEKKHGGTSDSGHQHVHGPSVIRTWLVNGERDPELFFPAGSRVHVRMINASNGGYLDLLWPGMRILGTDQGNPGGALLADRAVLGPGDRLEAEWLVGPERFSVQNFPHTLFGGRAYGLPTTLIQVTPQGSDAAPDSFQAEGWPPFEDDGNVPADIHYVFTGSSRTGIWLINGEEFPDISVEEVPYQESRIIEIRNLSPSQHPFHMHGTDFEVLAINGKAPAYRMVEDTLNLAVYDTVKIRVTNRNPGEWMVHCHILGHAHSGMMTVIRFPGPSVDE